MDKAGNEFDELLIKHTVMRFQQELGDHAESAMFEYAKLHIPESEWEEVERIVKADPHTLHVMVANMVSANPETLRRFLLLAHKVINQDYTEPDWE